MKHRIAQYVPQVRGCYGPRLWVQIDDYDLKRFCELLSVWTGPVDQKSENEHYWYCYEFPFDTMESDWMQRALARLNVRIIKEGEEYE